jgi:sulfite reductase (ferredoxin)
MQSFRTELENPLVEKDIIELENKIRLYKDGKIDPDKFRSLRLARGVYGQRQQGVQMVRIKLPFGRISPKQLVRIADISDEYSNGNLHLTTRQDIQIHFVSLDKTPELWGKLEQDDITLREACGNTVRNVTASAEAGIDPQEPFDVSPYADAVFRYFLRKPFCQELGRKIKIAFSSNDNDTAYTFIHDIGFIPKVQIQNGVVVRGFKVLVGGGLGAQPFLAQTAYEFLEEQKIISFIEATLRVFDRYGERQSRHKARIKYLVAKIGIAEFLRLVKEETPALLINDVFIDRGALANKFIKPKRVYTTFRVSEDPKYKAWIATNTFEQKQKDFYGVYIRILLGNISSDKAHKLADIIEEFAAEDFRITINQGLLLKFVRKEALPALFRALDNLGLASPGFNSAADITACPGTDTCNLGISSSTGIAKALEKVIEEEYPDLIYEHDLKIKISGCMNSCGQHGLAHIGFHGSSLKAGTYVVPALQVLLGGGSEGNGKGRIAEKVIKVPSKRGPDVVRILLNDFETQKLEGENFNAYFDRKRKDHFYQLLKPLADLKSLNGPDLIDWDQTEKFKTEIGVGECAGVLIDLVQTLFFEAEEKAALAKESLEEKRWGDSVYQSYAAAIHSAKALLTSRQIPVNTHHGVISDFDKHFVETGLVTLSSTFRSLLMRINENKPEKEFAFSYYAFAEKFISQVKQFRENEIKEQTLTTV